MGTVISVQIGIQLEPNQAFSGATLGVTPGSPVLLPGMQAVLLPTQTPDGKLWADSGAQAFAVTNGTVAADSSVPFHDQIDGLTPASVLTAAAP